MWQQIEENMQMLEKAVSEMKSRSRKLAEAEHNYRVALSERLTELRAEGQPVTHLSDIARGEKKIASLKMARDIAEGLYDSSKEAINMYKLKIKILEGQFEREWGAAK